MCRGNARFLDGLLDRLTLLPGDFLNPAQELILLALGILEIIVRELGPLLFQFPLITFQSPLISSLSIANSPFVLSIPLDSAPP